MAWASITKYSPFFLEPPPTPAKYKDVRPQTWTPLEARLFRVSSFLMSFHKPFKKKVGEHWCPGSGFRGFRA